MKPAYILIYALVATLPSYPADDVYQAIDETGVRLGAYFGCYTQPDESLVCILPELDTSRKATGKSEGLDKYAGREYTSR